MKAKILLNIQINSTERRKIHHHTFLNFLLDFPRKKIVKHSYTWSWSLQFFLHRQNIGSVFSTKINNFPTKYTRWQISGKDPIFDQLILSTKSQPTSNNILQDILQDLFHTEPTNWQKSPGHYLSFPSWFSSLEVFDHLILSKGKPAYIRQHCPLEIHQAVIKEKLHISHILNTWGNKLLILHQDQQKE